MSGSRFIDSEKRQLLYERLLARLHSAVIDHPDNEAFADALWLAPFLPRGAVTPSLGEPAIHTEVPRDQDTLERNDQSQRIPDTQNQGQRSTEEDKRLFPSPAPSADTGGIYAAPPTRKSRSVLLASPMRVSGGFALPNGLAISRALRPFRRFRDSRIDEVLDEEETVDRTAHNGRVTLVFRPVSEKLLDLALIVEETASMAIWRHTVAELQRLLERQGAFRDVRCLRLRFQPKPSLLNRSNAFVSPRALFDPLGTRLIIILTQGTHSAWRRKELYDWLWTWGARQPTAIFQLLPPRLWKNTILGPDVTNCKSQAAALPNTKLKVRLPSWYDPREPDPLPIPIVPLEAKALECWAHMTMALGGTESRSILIDRHPEHELPPTSDAWSDPKECLLQFERTASKEALELISQLAPIQFNVAVMRLVQRATLASRSRQTQLAEVLLSGLIQRVTPPDEETDGEQIVYKVKDEVKQTLLGNVTFSDAINILEALSNFIRKHSCDAVEFTALVPDEIGRFALPIWAQPFARAGEELWQRLNPSAEVPGAIGHSEGYRRRFVSDLFNELLLSLKPLDLATLNATSDGPHPLFVLCQALELKDLGPLEEPRYMFTLALAAFISDRKLDAEQPSNVRGLLRRLRRLEWPRR